ncbi:LOW QUALITY PROTEIN: beta-1,3-galactosyltransferase 6-like [Haliotis rubra]|uniref:LOW QUALITY PROTEIN: beta-1,3-galactosyltransferase 6-like n=1 Tax=Haliotis rubra TaxID=36100 RepID=UPI001EE60EFB|nr:LOW QUALITY PROTEIN: beta-1,3-galactosyltransferase 6-like [Haliotis rubra]
MSKKIASAMSFGVERRLNRHATTILIGGIFLTISALMFLSLCNMPCEDCTYIAVPMMITAMARKRQDGDKRYLLNHGDNCSPCHPDIDWTRKCRTIRHAIRETWLHDLPKDVAAYFVIGTKQLSKDVEDRLMRENMLRKDLLLLKYHEESYLALSKKLLTSLEWIHEHVDFKFLLKVDDDSFVRLDALLKELKFKDEEKLYWGFFDGRAHVKQRGKWKEQEWVLCDRYLPYALGGGYVVSSDLVHFVASNANYLKTFISEDVSLGVWLAPVNVNRLHDPRFDTEYRSRGCRNLYLVTHKKSILQMRDLHQTLQTTGHLCRSEIQSYKSYMYNWNVPPTLCCIRNDTSIP